MYVIKIGNEYLSGFGIDGVYTTNDIKGAKVINSKAILLFYTIELDQCGMEYEVLEKK